MSDVYRERAHTLASTAAGAQGVSRRRWVAILDSLYWVVIALAIAVFLYYIYSYKSLFLLYLPVFWSGTVLSMIISVFSIIFATIFGFIGAMARLSRFGIIRRIALVYVEVVRGTPILVQLLLWYYGFGALLAAVGLDPFQVVFQFMTVLQNNSLVPTDFDLYFFGILGLSFNYGAYLTEVFRAGIQSVDRGQSEAGLSLGLNSGQILRHIVLPQAIRVTIPPFTNNFITLIQDSSLLSIIGINELEHQTFALALPQVDPNAKLFVFVLGALFYLLLCYPLSLLARYYEARIAKAY